MIQLWTSAAFNIVPLRDTVIVMFNPKANLNTINMLYLGVYTALLLGVEFMIGNLTDSITVITGYIGMIASPIQVFILPVLI